ncbi:hypothetical protein BH11BAC3_BH11BAC3_20830 [soil metagenome]
MKKIFFKYIIIWVVLSVGYFFVTEPIAQLLFPGFYDVGIWLLTLIGGLVLILLILTIALIINIVRHRRRLNASS